MKISLSCLLEMERNLIEFEENGTAIFNRNTRRSIWYKLDGYSRNVEINFRSIWIWRCVCTHIFWRNSAARRIGDLKINFT